MTEFKPCPFCGGKAMIDVKQVGSTEYKRVRCTNCSALVGSLWYTRIQDAKRAWNRRYNNDH